MVGVIKRDTRSLDYCSHDVLPNYVHGAQYRSVFVGWSLFFDSLWGSLSAVALHSHSLTSEKAKSSCINRLSRYPKISNESRF